MDTAPTWDSFKDTLIKVLGEFKPQTVFEYGPGTSTLLMQDFPSVELIDTVEHSIAWYSKWKDKFGSKINLMLQKDLTKYPCTEGRKNTYDLIFIDGREREKCLVVAQGRKTPKGIVIIHDAEREDYKPFINMYRFIFFEDGGHTAVMTDNQEINDRLERIFETSRASA